MSATKRLGKKQKKMNAQRNDTSYRVHRSSNSSWRLRAPMRHVLSPLLRMRSYTRSALGARSWDVFYLAVNAGMENVFFMGDWGRVPMGKATPRVLALLGAGEYQRLGPSQRLGPGEAAVDADDVNFPILLCRRLF